MHEIYPTMDLVQNKFSNSCGMLVIFDQTMLLNVFVVLSLIQNIQHLIIIRCYFSMPNPSYHCIKQLPVLCS